MQLTCALLFIALIATASALLAASERDSDASPSKPPVELIAHRGESHDAPENTMAAFRLAWERNVPAVELDVHLTQDGKLICIHDANTKRVTGTATNLVVKDQPAAALQALDVGSWKAPAFAGERMPLLDDALASLPPGRRLFIEVKVGPEAVPELVRCLQRAGKPAEQTVVISFNIDTVREAKRALPGVKVYWLAAQKQHKETKQWGPPAAELIAKAKAAGVDGLNVAAVDPVDAEFVRAAKAAGLGFYVWTVDDPALARRMAAIGVDGITSNRAEWMRGQLATPQ